MSAPINAAMHEAESRSLWRAVFAAALYEYRDFLAARSDADAAVQEYTSRFPAKARPEVRTL